MIQSDGENIVIRTRQVNLKYSSTSHANRFRLSRTIRIETCISANFLPTLLKTRNKIYLGMTVKGKVWKYHGIGGWHFLTINKSVSARIKGMALMPRRGFGSIRVTAKIRKTEWKTSIFPTKEQTYLIAIKADVREKEHIEDGDTISVKITLLL